MRGKQESPAKIQGRQAQPRCSTSPFIASMAFGRVSLDWVRHERSCWVGPEGVTCSRRIKKDTTLLPEATSLKEWAPPKYCTAPSRCPLAKDLFWYWYMISLPSRGIVRSQIVHIRIIASQVYGASITSLTQYYRSVRLQDHSPQHCRTLGRA
jgi:hypothetical protein